MKKFASYLLPSLVATVFMSMYAMIDGIFIGQKIGDAGLAAINIVWPVTALLQSVGSALGLSAGILIQKKTALEEHKKASQIKLTVLLLGSILAILFGLIFYFVRVPLLHALGTTEASFSYAIAYLKMILTGSIFQILGTMLIPLLKNSGKVKLAATASLASMATNLILDYVMIYVLNMELMGAALASVLAQVAGAAVCLGAYFKELKGINFQKEMVVEIFKTSLAPFILAYSYSIVILITNIACTHYGGDEAVAAYTLLSYIAYILMAVSCAVGDSIQPLFSFQAAKKEFKQNRKMLKLCMGISLGMIVIFDILLIVLRRELGYLYNLSDTAYSYYASGLPYYLLGGILISILKVISSYLYAIDSKLFANILVLLEPFIVVPIVLAIFSISLQLLGIWISYFVGQAILLSVAGILLYLQEKIHFKMQLV
ncbi:MAG: polysaccharide biosynthesis C-terminal domain-containing protein [Anaeroplasmataceae bacterium]|nr:polysaccharide biosynthesis C-terminal domain-containing protein [Anaeroplasmataceae bacterium]MDE6414057.1 polysaccharide biosynthesis C-terminal domain-containing protein [Anaeroplasmataceae bacterium]